MGILKNQGKSGVKSQAIALLQEVLGILSLIHTVTLNPPMSSRTTLQINASLSADFDFA